TGWSSDVCSSDLGGIGSLSHDRPGVFVDRRPAVRYPQTRALGAGGRGDRVLRATGPHGAQRLTGGGHGRGDAGGRRIRRTVGCAVLVLGNDRSVDHGSVAGQLHRSLTGGVRSLRVLSGSVTSGTVH